MSRRCDQCGAPGSPSGRPASCPACQLPAPLGLSRAGPAGAAVWLPASLPRNSAPRLRAVRTPVLQLVPGQEGEGVAEPRAPRRRSDRR